MSRVAAPSLTGFCIVRLPFEGSEGWRPTLSSAVGSRVMGVRMVPSRKSHAVALEAVDPTTALDRRATRLSTEWRRALARCSFSWLSTTAVWGRSVRLVGDRSDGWALAVYGVSVHVMRARVALQEGMCIPYTM